MSYELDKASQYRAKAEELRANAQTDDNYTTRLALLKIADTYIQLARAMERVHESYERKRRPED
jgi:hypothetical protein